LATRGRGDIAGVEVAAAAKCGARLIALAQDRRIGRKLAGRERAGDQ